MSVVQQTSILAQPLSSDSGTARIFPMKQMILHLQRISHSKHGTFGVLSIDGKDPVYTLEETELEISLGTYLIELTWSPKFHRLLPLLHVPHRSNIRIHAGNWPRDSEGCILVGTRKGKDMILGSQDALDLLIPQIQQALDAHVAVLIQVSSVA